MYKSGFQPRSPVAWPTIPNHKKAYTLISVQSVDFEDEGECYLDI